MCKLRLLRSVGWVLALSVCTWTLVSCKGSESHALEASPEEEETAPVSQEPASGVSEPEIVQDVQPELVPEPSEPPAVVNLRVSPVPSPGVHPRIFLSPEDLPGLRQRLASTTSGKAMLAKVRQWTQRALQKADALQAVYPALVAGDTNALSKAGVSWWANQTGVTIAIEAFESLIDQDVARGTKAAAALTTLARAYPEQLTGLGYDLAYNWMSGAQRDVVRRAISARTFGKKTTGASAPPEERSFNWMPHGMHLLLLALAIEGEEGYDSSIYPKSVEVLRDFLTYGIASDGMPNEGMHYFNFGMRNGAPAMMAMAKRGDNLFEHPHYQRLGHWYAHSVEPFGEAFSMHGDTIDDQGGLIANYVALKWAYPEDEFVDFAWRNRIHASYGGTVNRFDLIFATVYSSDWEAASLDLPLAHFSAQRGLGIARSSNEKDALAVHFEMKNDLLTPGHSHSDRNSFTLSALGQKWAIDRGFHITESKDHSCVLIDGVGQGSFPPPGRPVAFADEAAATVFVGDAKYAYDYRWTFKSRAGNPENQGYTFEPEPLMPHVTSRAPENPVRRAFRTLVLVRGQFPYVLVLDDIQKDDQTRRYEWLMQTPNEVTLKSASGKDAVLSSGGQELLVRVVDSQAPTSFKFEQFTVQNTQSNEQFGPGKRLIVGCDAVAPDFGILLFPYRPGTALPTTTWNKDRDRLTIQWGGQNDEFSFYDKSERTVFDLRRNGQSVLSAN
jgi:hypothetical protein